MTDEKRVSQGRKNRISGRAFELKVRKDLESKGWIVSKWMNQVVYSGQIGFMEGSLVPAKHKFCGVGRPMAIGTGFPDFIVFQTKRYSEHRMTEWQKEINSEFPTICKAIPGYWGTGEKFNFNGWFMGVEVKSNGYLTQEEKTKCKWLLDNFIFDQILIAKKGDKRGEIVYEEFK